MFHLNSRNIGPLRKCEEEQLKDINKRERGGGGGGVEKKRMLWESVSSLSCMHSVQLLHFGGNSCKGVGSECCGSSCILSDLTL